MHMVIHQGKGINRTCAGIDIFVQFFQKPRSVSVVIEKRGPVDTSYHDVVDSSGDIKSWLTWHRVISAGDVETVNR